MIDRAPHLCLTLPITAHLQARTGNRPKRTPVRNSR